MLTLQYILPNILLAIQMLCAIIAIVNWQKIKHSNFKWFGVYLITIFLVEAGSKWGLSNITYFKKYYYQFFGIPIQFIFFYWLYAYGSLKNKKLLYACILIFYVSFIPHFLFFTKQNIIYSFNYSVGNIILLALVVLETLKQIKSDNILNFKDNMMFYINIGVVIFYIGTLPFFAFYGLILKDKEFWNQYYLFFLLANIFMYLIFSASLLWAKPNTF